MQVKSTLEGQAQRPAPTNGCWGAVAHHRISIASTTLCGQAQRPDPTRSLCFRQPDQRMEVGSLRQLAKVVNTKCVGVMPCDDFATRFVVAIRNHCAKSTRLNPTPEEHPGIGQGYAG